MGSPPLSKQQSRSLIMELQRHHCYDLIHIGMRELLEDRMGYYSALDYQQTLYGMTGKSSCLTMSDDELASTLEALKSEGYLHELHDFSN
ncbi:hypothetical protein FLL94_13440 [Vibrio cholerae]|nr:hypothetical protein FLL94_13440 [Vibrio cholerae]